MWDLMRIVDWVISRPDADASRTLLVGNSGGGMATLHAAACGERTAAAGVSDAYEQRFGDGGHRFYADLMWPWIESHIGGASEQANK